MIHSLLQNRNPAFKLTKLKVLYVILLIIFNDVAVSNAQQNAPFTRGVGVYPGDPKEVFSPSMKVDSVHYRNLALFRPVYQ